MRKYVVFLHNGHKKYGIIKNEYIQCIESFKLPIKVLDEIIKLTDDVEFLPFRPEKVICVGLNYKSHAEELHITIPERPVIFSKTSNTIATNHEVINIPKISKKVEFEGEIGLIIGSEIFDANEEVASDAILGIVPVNDITARDYQEITGQWYLSKSFDKFLPIGNEILEYSNDIYTLEVYKNGLLKQKSDSNDMIFPIAYLVAYISKFMILNPGDLICTGTPSGEKSVVSGDKIKVEINESIYVENTFV